MKRSLIAAAAVLAAVVLSSAGAGAGAAAPRASLRGFACQRAVKPVARTISITAVMRPLTGTQRMSLRFDLLSRTKRTGAWSLVSAGDLGNWVSPPNATLGQRPGDQWIVHKSVINLAAPDQYRMRVSFRWSGTGGRLLGAATRTTPTCVQPELRPDLLVQAIDVRPDPGHPNLNLYVPTIANGGATAARGFRVQFAAAGGVAPIFRTITLLRAHAVAQLKPFVGPICASSAASTVTIDPDGAVDDFNRSNNTLTADCSSAAGQP